MFFLVLVVGGVVAVVLAGVVFVDASRRGLRWNRRFGWAGLVGALSVGGFLLPVVFDGAIHRLYLSSVKQAPVVASPAEILLLHLAVGVLVSSLAALLYAFDRP